MDGTSIALVSTTVIAITTVIAAIINTFGQITVSRENEAKEKLRDGIDQLEDVYFKRLHPNETDRKKSFYRQEAEDQCGIYPRMSRKKCKEYADKIESGQSYLLIDVAIAQEQEKNQ
ncbi:MAG TPA: hypothetical protein ACQGQH_08445 [Xylella sp.]